ncbi:MAG: TrpB-like pyridoxal phosphate-dependent enzyme [Nitrospirota bacterium]|nr:TrpB-like pyridoxal phosphate-dependent enzyme [Nitrospirota bacterium]
MKQLKIHLPVKDIPRQWYNVLPSLPKPLPEAKDPKGDFSPIELMKKIRPRSLQEQDAAPNKWITIPEDVLDKYLKIGRPTLLQRAVNLEKYLKTPAKIFFKREDLLPTGSFKLNTSIAQAFYAKEEKFEGLISETGAGQWGTAVCVSAKLYDLQAQIFMARISYEQKLYRRYYMKLYGGDVYPSPSTKTAAGRKMLDDRPGHPGSIGTGISEAVETAANYNGKFAYVSGSNLPHVLLHQTVIGLETMKQMKLISEKPDILIACVGGGSNLGGFFLPFFEEKMKKPGSITFLAAESTAVPRLTKGTYRYDAGDSSGLTPLTKSYTLGQDFIPPEIHIGGLRQHSGSPIIGLLRHEGLLDAVAFDQTDIFEAGRLFSICEGILPAPESCHAISAAIKVALEAKEEGKERTIVFCLSGSGFFDLEGYRQILLSDKKKDVYAHA